MGEPGKFSGVKFAPKFLILRVCEKVLHFHELTGVLVKDCVEEVSGERPACGVGRCETVQGDEGARVQAGKDSLLGDRAVLDLTAGVACRGIIRAMIGGGELLRTTGGLSRGDGGKSLRGRGDTMGRSLGGMFRSGVGCTLGGVRGC